MSLFKTILKCPYCGNDLSEKPTRKKKCPHCSQYIYVRKGELLTEKQAAERDLIHRWLGFLERFGASERMFAEERKKLSKQLKTEAPANDTLWRMMNILIPRQTNPLNLERLYLLMGDFVADEGKDPTPYIQQAMQVKRISIRREVLGYKKNFRDYFQVKVKIMTCNDEHVCDACQKASRHTYPIDVFLEQMPIPDKCRNPRGCRCWVSAEFQ